MRKTRGDWGETFFPPPPPPFPSRVRFIFALLVLIRSHYTIWEPGTGYRKGGRNRRLLLASQNIYPLCRRDNFRDRNNAVRINTSFLHVLKVLEFERKLLFSALLTSDFFSGTLTCAWRILNFPSKIMCHLFWFSRRSWSARQMWNPPPLTCCCWGQQQVSEGFLVILVRMNSVLSVRYFLYDLLGIVKNLAQKV